MHAGELLVEDDQIRLRRPGSAGSAPPPCPCPRRKPDRALGASARRGSTVSAPAVLASSSSSSSDSSLSMPTSTARSAVSVRRGGIGGTVHRVFVRSISASHSSCGRRPGADRAPWRRRHVPRISASRNGALYARWACRPRSRPRRTWRQSACCSSALTIHVAQARPSARGCVCTQRTMLSRRSPSAQAQIRQVDAVGPTDEHVRRPPRSGRDIHSNLAVD